MIFLTAITTTVADQLTINHFAPYYSAGTPHSILDRNSFKLAIDCAGTAFHTRVPIIDGRLFVFEKKNFLRTYIQAYSAASTFIFI